MFLRFLRTAAVAFRSVIISTAATEAAAETSPTITAGSGAPTADANNGSIYLRTNGSNGDDSLYMRIGGAWVAIKGQTA